MNSDTVISGIALLVSVVFGVPATVIALKSRATAEKSWAEVKRSADAAERSANAADRSADEAKRSADAAASTARVEEARHHEERRPRLTVALDPGTVRDTDRVIYRVSHDKAVGLDSVIVHRPTLGEVEGAIEHDVARTGRGGWGKEVQVGPIRPGTYERFTLHTGKAPVLPAFRVKIVVRIGDEEWAQVVQLEDPRNVAPDVFWPRGVSGRRP